MACNRVQILVNPDVRFGSKADMCSAQADVRFVPIADILFDNLVGAGEH